MERVVQMIEEPAGKGRPFERAMAPMGRAADLMLLGAGTPAPIRPSRDCCPIESGTAAATTGAGPVNMVPVTALSARAGRQCCRPMSAKSHPDQLPSPTDRVDSAQSG